MENTEPKDENLWRIASRRVAFKRHFFIYLVINIFLWIVWYMNTEVKDIKSMWPLYTTCGWGIGVIFHYFFAFQGLSDMMVEREYKKLLKEKAGKQ